VNPPATAPHYLHPPCPCPAHHLAPPASPRPPRLLPCMPCLRAPRCLPISPRPPHSACRPPAAALSTGRRLRHPPWIRPRPHPLNSLPDGSGFSRNAIRPIPHTTVSDPVSSQRWLPQPAVPYAPDRAPPSRTGYREAAAANHQYLVPGSARVHGRARVYGNARVHGRARIHGRAREVPGGRWTQPLRVN
jgi:hypothetical protein